MVAPGCALGTGRGADPLFPPPRPTALGLQFLFRGDCLRDRGRDQAGGVFFFLAVGGYLIAGIVRKTLSIPRALLSGGLFVLIMAGSLILSNPVVYNAGAREEIVNIQLYKTGELDRATLTMKRKDYAKGPAHWEWTLRRWFGSPVLLGFLIISLLAGCLWGSDRLLNCLVLGLLVPYAIYLLWFVAVKADHYWLPVAVLLFAMFFNIPRILTNSRPAKPVMVR